MFYGDNQHDHGGYSPKELSVALKYKSLKEEIINNEIYSLNMVQLNTSITKTFKYIHTIKAKQTTYDMAVDDLFHYDIRKGSIISFDHLLSIILYTDWDKLSCSFSKTFRKEKQYETLSMVKRRNGEYANWGMRIRETVEYFGSEGWRDWDSDKVNKYNNLERGPYFCGMSFVMVIPQFNIRLNSPTSTSKTLEVATRFGGDEGILIQINNNGYAESDLLRSWNCCWLSNYNGEDERLWCGGDLQIKVESIKVLSTNENFHKYFKPLFYFDCMCSGNQMKDNMIGDITDEHYLVLSNLIKDRLTINNFVSKYHKYIKNTFHAFTANKQQIVISPDDINRYFPKLKDLIMHKISGYSSNEANPSSTTNLFKSVIFKLFPNIERVVINSTAFYGEGVIEYRIDISSLLLLIEKSISKNRNITIEIRADHQYKTEVDEESNRITKYSHISVSWLSSLKSECNAKNYQISFKEIIEQTDIGDKKVDILEIVTMS